VEFTRPRLVARNHAIPHHVSVAAYHDEAVERTLSAPTLELLAWISERPRSYADTMEAWTSHCPRLMVWEDAIGDGLVAVGRNGVVLTAGGRAALSTALLNPVS
jgi:hypothetical protein